MWAVIDPTALLDVTYSVDEWARMDYGGWWDSLSDHPLPPFPPEGSWAFREDGVWVLVSADGQTTVRLADVRGDL